MNIQKLKYKFHSGKNSKPWYYIKEYVRLYTPACILKWREQHLLDKGIKQGCLFYAFSTLLTKVSHPYKIGLLQI